MKYFHPTLIILFVIVSCNKNNTNNNNIEVSPDSLCFFTINTRNDLSKNTQFKLSSISDSVSFIFLETTPESLISTVKDIRIKDSVIFLMTGLKEIFVFSKSGKFLNKIGQRGRGPEEYYDNLDFTIDSNYVYILDYGPRIARYRNSGEFVNYFKLPRQPSRIIKMGKRFVCYIPDSQFSSTEDPYSWLVLNSNLDSISSFTTPSPKDRREASKRNSNHFVLTNFSNQYALTYKEAFNDTLYYLDEASLKPVHFGFIDLGIHKIDYTQTFEKITMAAHNMRVNNLIDIKDQMFLYYACMCAGNKITHLAVCDKSKGSFQNIVDTYGEEKIINDIEGPNFQPLACMNNKLIGVAESYSCCVNHESFSQKHNIDSNDNLILIVANLK